MKTLCLLIVSIFCLNTLAEDVTSYDQQVHRDIKSLSDKEIENYLNGNGMGLAKAAELNHYPGPRHVLDLAKPLQMSKSQIRQTRVLYKQMKVQAMRLGKELVEEEKILDRLFANNDIDEITLSEQLENISRLKSQLRFIHLNTHLKQKVILTHHQIAKYDALRGYSSGHGHEHGHHNP